MSVTGVNVDGKVGESWMEGGNCHVPQSGLGDKGNNLIPHGVPAASTELLYMSHRAVA